MVQRITTAELRSEICWGTPPSDRSQRCLDALLVGGTAPLWLPVLALLLLAKWVMDGGPVLFHQVRIGRGGEPFVLHKIRTTPPAYKPNSWDWPDESYPPRTAFGKWLRRVDLDELPQLWNVLKGEMSLVGPRPETPFHSRIFLRRYPVYSWRWQVRPGLTGLAQVRGWRGNTSMEQRLACDLEFVSGRSLLFYAKILAGTLVSECRRHSA